MTLEKKIALARANGTIDNLYSTLLKEAIHNKFNSDEIEAIQNNYMEDPTNEKYAAEFNALKEHRKACKKELRALLGIE